MFTAGVGETRSCVGREAKATSTNYSADRQAPDAYEQGIDEGCGDEGKQEAVTETASLLVWFFDELKTLWSPQWWTVKEPLLGNWCRGKV